MNPPRSARRSRPAHRDRPVLPVPPVGDPSPLPMSYVLPMRWESSDGLEELAAYLRSLAAHLEVVVVDGSPPAHRRRHEAAFGPQIRLLPVDPRFGFLNGKVSGVVTGVQAAAHDKVVIADDDVRYGLPELHRVCGLLEGAEVVIPQNYFDPRPWHACWDTARSLLNRALSADYPGTLALRRSFFIQMGGYDGDVLFENMELIRTARAAGQRVANCPDLLVRRRPPTVQRFWGQRVRQAYDDFSAPGRAGFFLCLLPALALAARRWGRTPLLAGAAASVALAEAGRRRGGGARVFPFSAALLAPVWMVERGACIWLALASRVLLGGCRYRGGIIKTAAHSRRTLRRRLNGPPPGIRPIVRAESEPLP